MHKMKRLKNGRMFGRLLVLTIVLNSIAMNVCAQDLKNELYYDTEGERYVYDIDEYLRLLNSGQIEPHNVVIEETSLGIDLQGILSDPSSKCSNIFGHKWGNWSSWEIYKSFHSQNGGPCTKMIRRTHYCERTYCNAYQTETDTILDFECCN